MNIEKLSSGSYRVRQMIDGKRYSITVPYKPSKQQAMNLISEIISNTSGLKGTFHYYAMEYIEIKEKVLSPRTIKEYHNTVKMIPDWFLRMFIDSIKRQDIQRVINELSVGRSAKTVKNYHGFIASVFNMYRPGFKFATTLPQKEKHEDYIPTADDVKRILESADGTEYHVFLKLACMGLRRSEICALTLDDLDDNNVLHINKALVLDKDNNWVAKSTKTTASTRNIPIPESLAAEIREQKYIFKQSPNSVIKWLNKTQDNLDIPRFPLHKLRHYFASTLMEKGATSKDIMALGGWETDNVMKTVYQHSMKKEDAQRKLLTDLSDDIF